MKKVALTLVVLMLTLVPASFAANTLTVNGPGLNSTSFALRVNLDDTANNVYVETQHPTAETHYLIRFWVDPTALSTLSANTSIRMGAINSTAFGQRIVIFLRHDAPGGAPQFQINTWGMQDAGAPSTYTFLKGVNIGPVAGAVPNQVEIEWTRSTGAGQPNAIFRIQRITPGNVGTNQLLNNLTMFDFTVDDARFGVLAGSGTNMAAAGSYKFDEFESYR